MNSPEIEGLREKVLYTLEDLKVQGNAKILLGFSGGPDSTALLDILASFGTYQLMAFYLDHGIRRPEETAEEFAVAEANCRKRGVPLFTEKLSFGALEQQARREGRSVEEAAREKRYTFLYQYAKQQQADWIALGHNYDDTIETLLMRIFQGSGYEGLMGIKEKRGLIIRPLSRAAKKDILAYLSEKGITYSVDSTNQSDLYLRNAVRNRLIPLIQEIFPGFHTGLAQFALKNRMVKELVHHELEKLPWSRSGQGYKISLKVFLELPEILKYSAFFYIYHKLKQSSPSSPDRVPFRFLKPLLDKNEIKCKNIILNGYGIKILKQQEYLFFYSDIVYNRKKRYLIVIYRNFTGSIGNSGGIFKISGTNEKDVDMVLKKDAVQYPLIIRSRRKGDFINTGAFTKSIKEFFVEWKVPEGLRERIPVIEDRSGIIGVFGKPFGFKNIVSVKHHKKNNRLEKNLNKTIIKLEEYGVEQSG